MEHAKLVFARNERYNFNGWKLIGHPIFSPAQSSGVAHDLIEHTPQDRGLVIEEIQAGGAFVFTRVDSNQVYRTPRGGMTVIETLGSNILSTIRIAMTRGYKGPQLKEAAGSRKLSGRHGQEKLFRTALAYVREHWDKELKDNEYALAQKKAFFSGNGEAIFMTALRSGYRWAEQRYKDPYRACTLFERIESEVDKVTAEAELGDEIEVLYSLQDLAVRVNLLKPSLNVVEV